MALRIEVQHRPRGDLQWFHLEEKVLVCLQIGSELSPFSSVGGVVVTVEKDAQGLQTTQVFSEDWISTVLDFLLPICDPYGLL